MIDWDWLWVVGEIGISYGFYRWWKSTDTYLAVLEVAPEINIDELKQFSSLTKTIDYASVNGLIQGNDSKSNSIINSQFVPDCIGVIHRITMREKKLEKIRTVWAETKNVISDVIRFVPFRLVSSKGNYIRIDKPLAFSSINDQLEVTHVKFDPDVRSTFEKFIDTFVGKIPTGIETKEEMLLTNHPLTGIGRLEKRSGIWYLIPHEQWGGILTRSSRNDILSNYRSRSNIARVLSIIFSITATCTAAYFIYRYYSEQQRLTNRLPPPSLPRVQQNNGDNQNNRLQCIICLENEIEYSIQPCSHIGLCHTCAETLQSRHNAQELCPICRTPIQQYQRIFLP